MGFRLVDEQPSAEVPKAPKGKFLIIDDGPKKNYYETSPLADTLADTLKNATAGLTSGAAKIGASLLAPTDYLMDKATGKTDQNLSGLITGEKPKSTNQERRQGVQDALKTMGADPEATAFKVGELGSEVAGTGGVGGALAKIPLLAKYAPRLAAAIESGGFKLGTSAPAKTLADKAGEWALRTTGGAITGGVSAAAVSPDSIPEGVAIGAIAPGAVKLAGEAGKALAPKVSEEVKKLYEKAKALGIDIPVDRILNSKPMNALAASLNYIPFSGRAATEDRMVAQLDRALSRTFGQDSPNVTMALRKAEQSLGDKFEMTFKKNKLRFDDELLGDFSKNMEKSLTELNPAEAKIIGNKIDELMAKMDKDGFVDGQAAYNIKKDLDRIGRRNSNEAFYATQAKKSLMDALDRSLGPTEAAAFKKLRQQYGNMLDLQGLAQNGAEGGVSVARLAGMKDIGNKELQDLADIAAQFVKTRESPHGALQRLVIGGVSLPAAGATGTLPLLAGTVVGGRVANTAMNSNLVKRAVLSNPQPAEQLQRISEFAPLRSLLYAQPTDGR